MRTSLLFAFATFGLIARRCGATKEADEAGTGSVAAPMVVDALAIGQMATQAARDAEWEKWEGVLITVTNVSELNSVAQIGGTTPDPTFQKFSVTGGLVVDSSLAAFPTGLV